MKRVQYTVYSRWRGRRRGGRRGQGIRGPQRRAVLAEDAHHHVVERARQSAVQQLRRKLLLVAAELLPQIQPLHAQTEARAISTPNSSVRVNRRKQHRVVVAPSVAQPRDSEQLLITCFWARDMNERRDMGTCTVRAEGISKQRTLKENKRLR